MFHAKFLHVHVWQSSEPHKKTVSSWARSERRELAQHGVAVMSDMSGNSIGNTVNTLNFKEKKWCQDTDVTGMTTALATAFFFFLFSTLSWEPNSAVKKCFFFSFKVQAGDQTQSAKFHFFLEDALILTCGLLVHDNQAGFCPLVCDNRHIVRLTRVCPCEGEGQPADNMHHRHLGTMGSHESKGVVVHPTFVWGLPHDQQLIWCHHLDIQVPRWPGLWNAQREKWMYYKLCETWASSWILWHPWQKQKN